MTMRVSVTYLRLLAENAPTEIDCQHFTAVADEIERLRAENQHLRQVMWDSWDEIDGDTDGKSSPHSIHDWPAAFVASARYLRSDYYEALSERDQLRKTYADRTQAVLAKLRAEAERHEATGSAVWSTFAEGLRRAIEIILETR